MVVVWYQSERISLLILLLAVAARFDVRQRRSIGLPRNISPVISKIGSPFLNF